jgi:protein-S-isoprenylcysteine O-methyltransferase Ste14
MLSRSGVRTIVVQFLLIIVSFAILFAAAGTLAWPNAWAYFVLAVVSQITIWGVLAKVNPEVVNARGSVAKAGTKAFDRAWLALYPVLALAVLIVVGFDAVRFHWSHMPSWVWWIGLVLIVAASAVGGWAMAVNKFFEWTVRIQEDRGQYVVSAGPYRFIRHPGYASAIMSAISGPLILGSCWGLVLSAIITLVLIARTALEDRALQKELPGYREYAEKVRYRLVPLAW